MDSLSQFSLSGKRALITGSSRGIGFGLARALAGAGAEIVLNSRDPEALGKAAAELGAEGAKVTAVAFDVTSQDSVNDAIEHIETQQGPIDILVNNAGITHRGPLEDFPADKFEHLLAGNVMSVFMVGQAVARHMITRRTGKIINVCSLMSALSRPTNAPYAATKAAVANLTRGMATDWAQYGLNVNGLAPGYFKTELTEPLVNNPEFSAWVEKRTPMRRWGEVNELGGATIFLASDASRFVNGHILYVDGALTVTI